jgi:hypothetical protein
VRILCLLQHAAGIFPAGTTTDSLATLLAKLRENTFSVEDESGVTSQQSGFDPAC